MTETPDGAHAQRDDGSYISVWGCERGHLHVGKIDSPPERCPQCGATAWARCTTEEAHGFIVTVAGAGALTGTMGFQLLGPLYC